MFDSGFIKRDQAKELRRKRDTIFFPSNLKFFKQHKGLRPGCLHGILAPTTAGKTTLCRTIIEDFILFSNKRVLVWLSEESADSYKTDLLGDRDTLDFSNLSIFSEVDRLEMVENREDAIRALKYAVDELAPEFLVIDNTTTGGLFGHSWEEHRDSCKALKSLAVDNEIPILFFCHSKKLSFQGTKILENEDVRGFGDIVNLAEYFYILQTFTVEKVKHTTLRITKNRGHDISEPFYKLEYGGRKYGNNYPIDFEGLKELIKSANSI